ncbi:HAMP domain-containing sensor histidine kinase [Nocardioides sp. 1609]|uniref:sensor histidine kinase n=1 Tax=Nocardioides sp. 1609 TaxID=2508327 RepID=UPI00106F3A73|nr:HAMP domain-containing sensor histidine kinase [Nocardioides sp. 1609]
MPDGLPRSPARLDVTTWSDVGSRDAMALVAASVAEMVGFEIAIISVVVGEHMYSISVEGSNEATDAMAGVATPIALVLPELERADDWGRFRFVPHDRLEEGDTAVGWIPDIEPVDAVDAWHPLDLLLAPLYDAGGRLIGVLSIDVPISGRRPDVTQRHLLERYAAQAERTLRMAVEREELAERIRLADAARRVVRFATSQDDLESVLDDCRDPLLEGMRADYLEIRTYSTPELPGAGSPSSGLPHELKETIRAIARRCWAEQQVLLSGPEIERDPLLDDQEHARLTEALELLGLGSAMVVPLGAGHANLGHLVLGRKDPTMRWSPDERAGALDIARDIGQAVVNSRNLAREQRLVGELRRLAAYKSQVLSTVSHELKNPLTAVSGYVEILEGDTSLSSTGRRSLGALDRAARRMGRLVDSLLELSEVEDPEAAVPSEVMDVRPLVDGALELLRTVATRRDLDVRVDTPEHPVLACCSPTDLERVLTNLVSNAVKYTPRGGAITVRVVEHADLVELAVVDEGIGISPEDQQRLFTEFFRSTNPDAVAQPGTGLGLTISARVIERHGGRIQVESRLGEGSTFRVFLPRPDAA